jgi:hypothetical protein
MDLQATIARIDRDIAQSDRLREEAESFAAEQRKLLRAEAGRGLTRRDEAILFRWIAAFLAAVAVLSAGAGVLVGFVLIPK